MHKAIEVKFRGLQKPEMFSISDEEEKLLRELLDEDDEDEIGEMSLIVFKSTEGNISIINSDEIQMMSFKEADAFTMKNALSGGSPRIVIGFQEEESPHEFALKGTEELTQVADLIENDEEPETEYTRLTGAGGEVHYITMSEIRYLVANF